MEKKNSFPGKGILLLLPFLLWAFVALVNGQLAMSTSSAANLESPGPNATAVAGHITTVLTTTTPTATLSQRLHLPMVRGRDVTPSPTPTNTPTNTPTPTPTPTLPPLPPPTVVSGTHPIAFATVRADLQHQGLDLAYNKIGFHTGHGGNTDGLYEYMQALDAAGVPFFLKSALNPTPIVQAQELMKASGVPHTLVYRFASSDIGYDVPDYSLPPAEAARQHWEKHLQKFPTELDKNLVWLETINEVDKERSQWLGEFALATAQLALQDGYRWAAFGWSSGEPEPEHWESPAMLEFLRLAGEHPDQLAIAVHEYSYTREAIGNIYPWLVGRFQKLFQVCDKYGIPRPTILITEWGWEYNQIPETEEAAMEDIAWASWFYAAYPQVKGAAIWYLGGNFGDIHNQTQKLIAPLTDYSLTHYFAYDPGFGSIDDTIFWPDPPTNVLSLEEVMHLKESWQQRWDPGGE